MFLFHTRKNLLHLTQNSSFLHKSSAFISLSYFSTSKLQCDSNLAPNSSALVSDFLIQKHQFSPQAASLVASRLSRFILNYPRNSDSVIFFLKDYGFSQTQLERIVGMCPDLLTVSPENIIKPKFNCFKDFGFSDAEIVLMVSKDGGFLARSLSNRIAPGLTVLNGLLGSHTELVKLLMSSGWFLVKDLEKTLLPNIEYLTSCGVPMDQIRRYLRGFSRFFLIKPEEMKQSVEKADRLGADRSSRTFLHSVRFVSAHSDGAWESKLQAFRELGFSEADITKVIKSHPSVLSTSEEKMKVVKELLLSTGKYTMDSIISCPKAFSSSVENIYKPRLRHLEVLEHQKLIQKWPCLSFLCKQSDAKFFQKFIVPQSSLE